MYTKNQLCAVKPAFRISNYTHSFVWNVITHSWHKFFDSLNNLSEVKAWMIIVSHCLHGRDFLPMSISQQCKTLMFDLMCVKYLTQKIIFLDNIFEYHHDSVNFTYSSHEKAHNIPVRSGAGSFVNLNLIYISTFYPGHRCAVWIQVQK